MSFYTLVYESTATPSVAATMSAEIESMLATARRRNPAVGIGGALLVTEGRFVQALEGKQSDVQATFDRISLDPRHSDIEILCAQSSTRRRFTEWSMAFVGDTAALRSRYADEPLASLVHKRSGDSLVDFMREIAMSDEDD
ncbi:BLUF domain-containing protein [Sphingomonas sp. PAMC 26621]|uniref:BLUF domain-containing protein n=1 Tax=Sphingomonas sp. PAMC 26621 TaxID=1112213 RepID=UPI0002882091|nr:BLUF domain-containing protein [Sphingomonas sp. PAMC 26621]